MAAGNEIAKLFGTLGFKVDNKGVKQFERTMNRLEKRMKGLGQAQSKAFGNGRGGASKGISKQATAIERLTSRYDKFGGALQRIRNDMQRTNALYKSGNISAEKRNDLLRRMAYQYDKVAKARARYERYGDRGRGRPSKIGPQLRGAMSGFIPGIGGGFAAMQSVQSYQQSVGMEQALTSASGDPKKAGDDMKYLVNQSRRLGLYIGNVGRAFANMTAAARGTSLAGEGVRHVFEGIASQARVLNLSAADTDGIFRAITQIMNKQQVMAEELKNQLGERMPGAIQATARAMGYLRENGEADTQALFKAMQNGELVAEEVLPKLSDEMLKMANTGGALDKAMTNTSAAIARFRTNLWLANRTFNESGFDKSVRNLFNSMSDAIMKAEPLWRILGKSSEVFVNALRAPIELFGVLGEKMGIFVNEDGPMLSDKMKGIGAAIMLAVRPLRKLLFLFGILPAAFTFAKDIIENGFDTSSWKDLAIQIGTIVAAVTMLAPKLLKIARSLSRMSRSVRGLRRGGFTIGTTAGSALEDASRRDGKRGPRYRGRGKGILGMAAGNPYLMGAMALIHSKSIGGGKDFINGSEGRMSFTEKLDSQNRMLNLLKGTNSSLNPSALAGAGFAGNAPQVNGDIVFNVTTNDPEEFFDTVNQRLDEVFRGTSATNPVDEK